VRINLEPCDEIITTPMSDMGTVIPILMANYAGIADIEPVTGNLTAETMREDHGRTRAVIVVHLLESRGNGTDPGVAARRHCTDRGLRAGTSRGISQRKIRHSATWAASACSNRNRLRVAVA
jgi:hypothetical protein